MNKNKGLGRLIVIACALAIACTLVLSTSFLSVRAEAANDVVESSESYAWYDISNNGRELNVHLSNYLADYEWKYGMSSDILEQRYVFQMESEETAGDIGGEYSLHFMAGNMRPAETTLTFSYIKDSDSQAVETKTIKVKIDEDGKLEVL